MAMKSKMKTCLLWLYLNVMQFVSHGLHHTMFFEDDKDNKIRFDNNVKERQCCCIQTNLFIGWFLTDIIWKCNLPKKDHPSQECP
jgi:hypothetical protein